MLNDKQYISKEKKADLEKELAELKGTGRKAILDALSFAKSLGDLSENAEYHNAREEQGRLEERIIQIEETLKNSEIVTSHSTSTVGIGSVVVVTKEGDKEKKEFTIVGDQESDMSRGMISYNSPLGQSLMGNKKGDDVVVISPKGKVKYSIISIK
jgi:transcription elongation factor GreA